MESIGDEKRIRALFSEVRFADEQAASGFTATWHRAQSRALRPRRAFNLSLVTATALLILALGGLAVWSRYTQPGDMKTVAATAAANFSVKISTQLDEPRADAGISNPAVNAPRRLRRPVHSQALTVAKNRQAEQQAKQLANWQSPTSSLLASPSDNLFKSLPQLNENANEMKSFLPNRSNDKEK
jgi:hypothetical protein